MHMNKTVAIISIDETGCDEALRHVLESFGYLVVMYWVSRPRHFIDLLQGKMITKFDFIIIDSHGDDGKIVMPELGEDIYYPDEPRGNFGVNEISKYLTWKDTCVIINGCSTGTEDMAKVFVKNNNIFLAPDDYIEGDSDLIFVVLFFYYLTRGFDIETAYKKASSLDDETGMYILRK